MTRKRPTPFPNSAPGTEAEIPVSRLPELVEAWLINCDISQHSRNTISSRRERLGRLVWFLSEKKFTQCGLTQLRAFFHYLNHGHEQGGRWGNPKCIKPLAPGRIKAFHSSMSTFFSWCVEEGYLSVTPMQRIPSPIDRPDQIQPFSDEQIQQLLLAAKRTMQPRRDEAILLVLLDTGMRASELCSLTVGDVNLTNYQIAIRHGKGGKARYLPISRDTRRALFQYLAERASSPDEPLFLSERGKTPTDGLTPWGLILVFKRLGKAGGVQGVRCSPHTLRHSYAISYLRGGASEFALQMSLGHTSLAMTRRYCALVEADLAAQHRQFSPVMRLKQLIREK